MELITSEYAAEEARFNLEEEAQKARLNRLLRGLRLLSTVPPGPLPRGVDLPESDRSILLGAIRAQASHLLTGDRRDSGKYFGRRVKGVLTLPPSEYFKRRGEK